MFNSSVRWFENTIVSLKEAYGCGNKYAVEICETPNLFYILKGISNAKSLCR